MSATPIESVLIVHNGHIIKGKTQQDCFKRINKRPVSGYTAKEIRTILGLDHGKVSGALSWLHKKGLVALLNEKRDGYRVYVIAEHVGDRPTKARKS